jgi:DNA-binding transcriptional MerR regulator
MPATTSAWMRISEFSARVEVSPTLLRAWEQRYGLLTPRRAAGGARLYTAIDEARVRMMKRHLAQGISAAQAAELVLAARMSIRAGTGDVVTTGELERATGAIRDALDRYDETGAQLALQSVLTAHTPISVIRDLIIPYMRDTGERWAAAHISTAQEHFASNFFVARLLALSRGWDHGLGPRALLACGPDDQHTIALIAFGIALHDLGWRITYLGADTPIDMTVAAATQLQPDLITLSISINDHPSEHQLQKLLSSRWPLALAGPGTTSEHAGRSGARHIAEDPITASLTITTST